MSIFQLMLVQKFVQQIHQSAAGLFFALARLSLELQKRKEEERKKLEFITQISESFMSLLSNYKQDNKYH